MPYLDDDGEVRPNDEEDDNQPGQFVGSHGMADS